MDGSMQQQSAHDTTQALETSHEAIWASMQTVVVRDCPQQPIQKQPAALVEDSSDSGEEADSEANDIDIILGSVSESKNDACKSSGSSTPDSGGSPRCIVVDSNGTHVSAPEWHVKDKSLAEEADALGFRDLFGQAANAGLSFSMDLLAHSEEVNDDAILLPSVEEARQHLDDIAARRSDIKAKSARYFPLQSCGSTANAANGAKVQLLSNINASGDSEVAFETDSKLLSSVLTTTSKGAALLPQTRPVRAYGPCLKPNSLEVSDVMQQLATHLRQLSASSKSPAPPQNSCSNISKEVSNSAQPETVAGSSGFTVGGYASHTRSAPTNPGTPTAVDCVVGKAGRQGGLKVSVDQCRLRAAREQEESRCEEMWQQFLAGNDLPVGDDGLPPPELYFKGVG